MSQKGIIKFFLLIGFFFLVINSYAQKEKFIQLLGKVKVENGKISNTQINVYLNNNIIQIHQPNKKGKFKFNLPVNNTYTICFSKPGFVEKRIEFNASVPENRISFSDENLFAEYWLQVSISKTSPELEMFLADNLVGKIKFEPEIDDFEHDYQHTKTVLTKYKEVKNLVN
jgi:hypothetical protein